MKRLILGSLALLAMSGCASMGVGKSDFACPGYPEGVQCKSAREVYKLTENRESLGWYPDQGSKTSKEGKEAKPAPTPLAAPPSNEVAGVREFDLNTPIPVRTPPKVLRMWVAPWIDEDQSLHMPTYIYVEIEPRKWKVGEKQYTSTYQRMRPLEVTDQNGKVIPNGPSLAAPLQQPQQQAKTPAVQPGQAAPSPSASDAKSGLSQIPGFTAGSVKPQ